MATTADFQPGWCCVGFVGWHHSGKTTLVRRVAMALQERGHRVAILKATDHRVAELLPHRPGSDTALFQEDGIHRWGLVGPDMAVCGFKRGDLSGADLAFRLFPEVDFVLVEGFKSDPSIPKIAVCLNPSTQKEGDLQALLKAASNVKAVAVHPGLTPPQQLPAFRGDDLAGLVRFMEEELRGGDPAPVTLWTDQGQIGMNRFVRAALHGSLHGFIRSLRGTASAAMAVVRLRLKGDHGTGDQ